MLSSSKPQCLTDELLAELIDGRLAPEALSQVHRHAAECEDCRELLVTVARGGLRQEDSQEHPPEPPAAGWAPPVEFDEFCLVRPLGRGAMGVVYLADDRSLDRQVAVKFIAAHQPNARARERFQNEARAIARLQHPNVVTVFRIGEVGGHPYIVSEYLVGQSLAQLAVPLPWRRALGLSIGLARGLAAAHRQGVLHRDLKPDNVLLTVQGEVKLLDFGLAELVDASAPMEPNGVRAVVGTPRYMAPELFRGASATPRSDLYALGLILYELCTGTLPPRHRPGLSSLNGQSPGSGPAEQPGEGRSPPLTESVPGIDPDFASLIERCLRVDPDDRFASAEALCTELERLEPLHEPEVLPAGNPYRGLAPFEAEHRALFFGRDADIREVLERLRRRTLVLVAGDSGVGKSSLCRAGILPRVAQGLLDESRVFSTLTLEPGRLPLAALAAALAPLLGQTEAELGALLAETPEWLGPALRAAYQKRRGLLLFIDQAEELVTLSEPAQATRFAKLLGELALPAEGVRVLLAVRGDFLTRVAGLPGLGSEVEGGLFLLRPLTPDSVREAIVGPARSRGVVFESEMLLQTLVQATAQDAGSLPLLQFTLAELWERRDHARSCITQAALDEMGGVAGALSRHADGVLARLERAEQQAARRLLGRLITADGTRSERSEEELTADSEETRAALRALVEGRLLHARTEGGRASYEIAHEALIASWGTLRHWIDEGAGQRALRQRLEEAGTEWDRLGRAEELLWRQRQLNEAQVLETASLGPREQDFLRASQRAVRRQGLRRWLVALLLVLTAGGIYGQQIWRVHQEADQLVEKAQDAFSKGRELSKRASASREDALTLFTGQPPVASGGTPSPQALWERAEEVWKQALHELEQANAEFIAAEEELNDALKRVYNHPEAQRLLIELTYDRILLAERFHQKDERARLMKHFERLTASDKAWEDRLKSPAVLEIVTVPPGASVELTQYVEDDKGVLQRRPVPGHTSLSLSPIAPISLPAGSYHLRFSLRDHAPVDLPLLLERNQHEQVRLTLPSTVPEGYVYIPPGCFLTGSADLEAMRKFQRSAPLHRRCMTEGYVIGQTEVTVGDWLAYLNTLPKGAPERGLLDKLRSGFAGAIRLQHQPGRGWSFSLQLESERVLTAGDGEPLRYPNRRHHSEQNWRRFPLSGVSAEDVAGYLSWLSTSGHLPGARLCHELEWTRAARGADDRSYPHGNNLYKDDANIDVTYDRLPDAYGPDEVGAHRASISPFGIYDMVGNAYELTESEIPLTGGLIVRGGAWYYSSIPAMIAHREPVTSKNRDATLGVRVCASFPPK